MYILFKSDEQKKSIINRLESMGFEKSGFSYGDKDAIGVGTFYNPYTNEKFYIYFSPSMVYTNDEYFSWAKHRTKAETEEEFFNGLEKQMKMKDNQKESY